MISRIKVLLAMVENEKLPVLEGGEVKKEIYASLRARRAGERACAYVRVEETNKRARSNIFAHLLAGSARRCLLGSWRG